MTNVRSLFYKLRDSFWNYPYVLFFGDNSLFGRFRRVYNSSRPFSHVIATGVITLMIFSLVSSNIQTLLGFNRDVFIEGVIMGTDSAGNLRTLDKLNPFLINSVNRQLENDIMALVYQPLLRVEFKPNSFEPEVIPVLAENFSQREQGGDHYYRFNLRKDVKWHDGVVFNADDVVATFNFIKELAESDAPNVFGANIADNLTLEKLDEYICEFKLTGNYIPNFYELIAFKIAPAHLIDQLKDSIISGAYQGNYTLTTVGTGPFQLTSINEKEAILRANTNYYLGVPKIREIQLRFLTDVNEAVAAIRSGLIHGITNINSEAITDATEQPNFVLLNSPTIYTQYWALYFNLNEGGPGALKDLAVKKAINLAIDKELTVKATYPNGEVAQGTIPQVSAYFNPAFAQPKFNIDAANQALDASGWVLTTEIDEEGNSFQVRKKEDQLLDFNFVFSDNDDRQKVANAIKSDLNEIGVHVNLRSRNAAEMPEIRANYDFDILLFGVSTFIDPDRFEFFSSDQAFNPEDPTSAASGLNIGDYKSTAQESIVDPETRRVIRVPAADRILEEARQEADPAERKRLYDRFQKLLFDDTPLVFLYHPTLRYVVNKRIKNIDLTGARYLEDRFNNVQAWQIDF